MPTWTKRGRMVDVESSDGWGEDAWGDDPWGSPSGTIWTKQTKTSDTWTKITKVEES